MDKEKIKVLEEKIHKDYQNITGIVVLQEGETLYEQYFQGCDEASHLHIYSVTKSIVSILIGIAIDQGYIKSIDQKILDFFPNYVIKKREKMIQQITISDMLTMTAPYKYRFAPYIKYFTSDDMVTFSLDLLGGKKQCGTFRYTPLIGPDILTGLLKNATGMSVLDYARIQLFTPLGISIDQVLTFKSKEEQMDFNTSTTISGWAMDIQGVNMAGWGLSLTTMDMAKIGQLYANKGIWQGKQLVSSNWIEESTKEHSRWEKADLPYGYLWWIHENGFMAMGDGGNVIYINTKKQVVVAITSKFKPNVTDRMEFIEEYILPAM